MKKYPKCPICGKAHRSQASAFNCLPDYDVSLIRCIQCWWLSRKFIAYYKSLPERIVNPEPEKNQDEKKEEENE